LDPAARLIVSSGYAEDPVMANFAEFGFKGVIAKPYHLNKLSEVLSQVMEC
jgi:CheY-like chemotaxis protein